MLFVGLRMRLLPPPVRIAVCSTPNFPSVIGLAVLVLRALMKAVATSSVPSTVLKRVSGSLPFRLPLTHSRLPIRLRDRAATQTSCYLVVATLAFILRVVPPSYRLRLPHLVSAPPKTLRLMRWITFGRALSRVRSIVLRRWVSFS